MSNYKAIKEQTSDVLGVRVIRRRNTKKAHAAIRDAILQNPTLTYGEIAQLLECSRWLIYSTAVKFGIRRTRGAGSPARRKNAQRQSQGE